MDKAEFVKALKVFKEELNDLRKECSNASGAQIQNRGTLIKLEVLATKWFDEFEGELKTKYKISENDMVEYGGRFRKMLELVGRRPSKRVIVTILDSVLKNYQTNIMVVVQMSQAQAIKYPILDTILERAQDSEIEYLTEAIECARLDKKRAAIVLGWCSAVNRLHIYVEKKIGFDRFNKASQDMVKIKMGRYKRYDTPYEIHNLGELRTSVSDNNLLWLLEFLESFDGQQHDRLSICLSMRDSCAHPGESTISGDNLSSFFSDLDTLIFNNPTISIY